MKLPNLPTEFLERIQRIFTEDHYSRYLQSFTEEKKTTFRVNTLKTNPENLLKELAATLISPTPIAWYQDAFAIEAAKKSLLTHSFFFQQGFLYIQNLSSIFASLALDPKPGEEILDLAAAPGGKTLHMAALMNNQGRIAAVEAVKDRFFRLKANIKLSDASIVQTYLKDGSSVWRFVPEHFDRVLLDAPCSSEGRFDPSNPKSFVYWSEKKISEMSRKQKKLIFSAIKCLKPGGVLLYCTCSLAPEENEAVINYALEKFSGSLEVLPLAIPFDNYQPGLTTWQEEVFKPEIVKAIRIVPNDMMAGFFICKLRKI